MDLVYYILYFIFYILYFLSECGFSAVLYVQESILFSVPPIEFPHQVARRGQDICHKQEEALIGGQRHALSNDERELTEGQIPWHEELVLVQERDRGGLRGPLDDDGDAARELLEDSIGFSPPLC